MKWLKERVRAWQLPILLLLVIMLLPCLVAANATGTPVLFAYCNPKGICGCLGTDLAWTIPPALVGLLVWSRL